MACKLVTAWNSSPPNKGITIVPSGGPNAAFEGALRTISRDRKGLLERLANYDRTGQE